MTTIANVVTQFRDVVQAVDGIAGKPKQPPAQMLTTGVTATAYTTEGEIGFGAGNAKTARNVVRIAVLKAIQDHARDAETMQPFLDSISNAIGCAKCNGTFTDFTMGKINYAFGEVAWGGVTMIGYLFDVQDVVIKTTISCP